MNEETKNLLSNVTTKEEMDFLNKLTKVAGSAEEIQRDKIMSDFYLAKMNEGAMDRQIESHKTYARALNWLTGGLIFVGLVQAAVLLISAFAGK